MADYGRMEMTDYSYSVGALMLYPPAIEHRLA
jgi:hypothetical protein